MSVTAIDSKPDVSDCQRLGSRPWVDGSRTVGGGCRRRPWPSTRNGGSTRPRPPRSPIRAGLTERTFFRHFADKREVLFGASAILQERIVAGVAGAPAGDGPLDAVACGLDAAAAMLGESRRDLAAQRQAVIAANPELRERELAKLADYAAAVAAALRRRGVREPQATLAAETGMTVLRVAIAAVGKCRRRKPGLADIMRDSWPSCGRWQVTAEDAHRVASQRTRAFDPRHRVRRARSIR